MIPAVYMQTSIFLRTVRDEDYEAHSMYVCASNETIQRGRQVFQFGLNISYVHLHGFYVGVFPLPQDFQACILWRITI